MFDFELINKMGWYNAKTNSNGLTMDHKVSVNESLENGYDSFYIKHPLNCELMPWLENKRKNNNSSMRYSDLVRMVNEWESIYKTWDFEKSRWRKPEERLLWRGEKELNL